MKNVNMSRVTQIPHLVLRSLCAVPLRYFVITILFVLGMGVWSIGKTSAATNATVFFVPTTSNLETNQSLSLRINSLSSNIGFVRVVFSFDNTKINLSGEITHTSPFDTEVEKTTMSDANATGHVTLVFAIPPTKAGEAPAGNFEIAAVQVQVLSGTPNDTTTLTFNSFTMQLVDMQNTVLLFDVENPTYTLNFVPTPTPTVSLTSTLSPTSTPLVTITPLPSVTNTPTATLTPTNSPTSTPTFSPSPTATLTPTVTNTPIPTATNTSTPTSTPLPTQSLFGTITPTGTPTITQVPSHTATVTPTPKQKQNRGKHFGWFSSFLIYISSLWKKS